MKILTVGGGSGGHVTPVRAVLNELARLDPQLEAVFVCDKAFEAQSRGLMEHADVPVTIYTIPAGKLRRYAGVPLWKQLLDLPTMFHNAVDIFRILAGFVKSFWLIGKVRPDVIFAKGGFVCLPLGIAARVRRVPLVIHDSDARPGLTNKVLSRWADKIATGSPLENYPYNRAISQYVGVPINPDFHPFSEEEQKAAKLAIGVVDTTKPLLVVTGGGLGAKTINDAVVEIARPLIDKGIEIYHVTGRKHSAEVEKKAINHPLYHIVPFVYKDMAQVLGAADVVISRGSATFLQELAALQKAVIAVPAKHLGDQVKNAKVYQEAEAVTVVTDDELAHPEILLDAILELIENPAAIDVLSERLHEFARPDAALDTAKLIVDAAHPQKELMQDV